MKTTAIVLCAGKSTRMGGKDKLLASLGEDVVFMHSVRAFTHSPHVDEVVVVVSAENLDKVNKEITKYRFHKPVKLVLGGIQRHLSARQGFLATSSNSEIILVHDGARPLLSADLIKRVWQGTKEHGACVPAVLPVDTIKETIDGQTIDKTLQRQNLRITQTPQGFKRELLLKAYESNDHNVTDDAQIVEQCGYTVYLCAGEDSNIKVTIPQDLLVATLIYNERQAKHL
ncbi:MAG: 2-C-methyl-D-erythritol 4-phosphate cytidylyltransferase [Chloroflexi bacterium]|nr:2-C-methyl-D-erythritol 4-phosphate cytidylyltransferase [Chloroflexota bacterium]